MGENIMNIFKCRVKGKLDPIIVEDVTSVANAFGVLKSEYNVSELDVISIELIEPEYTIEDWYNSIKEDLKPWMQGRYSRSCCPQEMKYYDMKLEEIECPRCGKKALWQPQYGDFGFNEYYRVECDECDYIFPIQSSDCGECICEAKTQLGIFELLGRPSELLDCDLQLLLYKDANERQKYYEELATDDTSYSYVNKEVHKRVLDL